MRERFDMDTDGGNPVGGTLEVKGAALRVEVGHVFGVTFTSAADVALLGMLFSTAAAQMKANGEGMAHVTCPTCNGTGNLLTMNSEFPANEQRGDFVTPEIDKSYNRYFPRTAILQKGVRYDISRLEQFGFTDDPDPDMMLSCSICGISRSIGCKHESKIESTESCPKCGTRTIERSCDCYDEIFKLYFDDGKYLGPDEHGVEPTFELKDEGPTTLPASASATKTKSRRKRV